MRTSRIVVESRRFGRVGQLSHPVVVGVRNLVLRVTPQRVLRARMLRTVEFRP